MVFRYLTGLFMGILLGLGVLAIESFPTAIGLGTVVLVILSFLIGMALASNET
jgi:hypothetical protein